MLYIVYAHDVHGLFDVLNALFGGNECERGDKKDTQMLPS